MEFVSFPSLKETKGEVFDYLKETVKCRERLYLYPLTNNFGVAFCGEPDDEKLLIAVLGKRALNRGEPFVFFSPFVKDNQEHLGVLIYDGKEVEGYVIFFQEKPVKSVVSYVLKKNKPFKFFFYGPEEKYRTLLSYLSKAGFKGEVYRVEARPITDKERAELLKEPSPFEFLKTFGNRFLVFADFKEKLKGDYKKVLKPLGVFLLFVCLAGLGYEGAKFYAKFRKSQVTEKVKNKRTVFTAYDKNRSAYLVFKPLLDSCTNGVVSYEKGKVKVLGFCSFAKGGKVKSFQNGEPVEVVYPVMVKKAKGKPLSEKEFFQKALSYGATGTIKDFVFTVPKGTDLSFLFSVNFPLKVKATVYENQITVEVER